MPADLFLSGEWIEVFHNLLRENQSYWVMLGYHAISVAPRENQTMCLDFWPGY